MLPPNAMGGTFGRFFFVFGVPLLLTLRRVALPRALIVVVVAAVALGQLIVPATHFVSHAEGASAKPDFFAPALAFAAAHHDADYRFHVVALSNHWEAYYFPVDDFAITRGWYRQSDALHNDLLNQRSFSDRPVRRLAAPDGREVRLSAQRAARSVGPPGDRAAARATRAS